MAVRLAASGERASRDLRTRKAKSAAQDDRAPDDGGWTAAAAGIK